MDDTTIIRPARFPEDIIEVQTLFQEYASSLNFSLCFQDFDKEVATLPGKYASPAGVILLADWHNQLDGVVALRPLEADACEMKRLYVRPALRGRGVGRMLVEAVIAGATQRGYKRMRLDTIAELMPEAVALYRTFGFMEIPPYTPNPVPGAYFMELKLPAPPRAFRSV